MTTIRTPQMELIDGWPFQVYMPPNLPKTYRVMLLLHGYQGNENVMWILTKPIPSDYAMLSPRAPIQTGPDQYSWHAIAPQWPDLDAHRSLAESLFERLEDWTNAHHWSAQPIDIMGFSQGAVLALAMGILYPNKIGKTAILAGFLPQAWIPKLPTAPDTLSGKPFFIAHGTQDEIVPIAKAQRAATWLKENGADVTFCEADTGHKISANCFNSLGKFFS